MGVQVHFKGGYHQELLGGPKHKDNITNKSWVMYRFKCTQAGCKEEYTGKLGRSFRDRIKEHLRAPSPIYNHGNTTGHHINVDSLSIVGREVYSITRIIKEAMFIRIMPHPSNGP